MKKCAFLDERIYAWRVYVLMGSYEGRRNEKGPAGVVRWFYSFVGSLGPCLHFGKTAIY